MPSLHFRPEGSLIDAPFHDDHRAHARRVQTLLGGSISLFTELCEKTRAEAFEMMVVEAR